MIDLYNGQITDLLNNGMRYNPETISISYAILQEKQRLLTLLDRTRLMALIDSADEKALDYLAVELRTPSYHDSFPIRTKQTLVEGALTFYMKMGTPYAVNKIIEAIFQAGHIREWFEYGGSPFHFKAYTTNPAITQEDVNEFTRVLSAVKRLSAWLDEIILDLSTDPITLRIGHWLHTGDYLRLGVADPLAV